jgi:hypothetical protein
MHGNRKHESTSTFQNNLIGQVTDLKGGGGEGGKTASH